MGRSQGVEANVRNSSRVRYSRRLSFSCIPFTFADKSTVRQPSMKACFKSVLKMAKWGGSRILRHDARFAAALRYRKHKAAELLNHTEVNLREEHRVILIGDTFLGCCADFARLVPDGSGNDAVDIFTDTLRAVFRSERFGVKVWPHTSHILWTSNFCIFIAI